MKLLTPLLVSIGLAACSPSAPPLEEDKPTSRYIGQIASVHTTHGFVLIRRSPGTSVSAGTILISQGRDGNAANLRVSGEKLGQMIAADIQSGSPQAGDSVREPLIEKIDLEAGSTD